MMFDEDSSYNDTIKHHVDLDTPAIGNSGGVLLQSQMTFMVSPPMIKFKDYKENGSYYATLKFKNMTTTAQYIRLARPEGRIFSISTPKGSVSTLKVAPGLDITYTIYFNPEMDSDYECDLIAFTDNERFIVPVRAIGSRGLLALPEALVFEDASIKSTSRKTLLVTNVGRKPCEWRATATDPFSVEPPFGMISSNGSQQIVVKFHPLTLMNFQSSILFDLGRGETQSLSVSGNSVNVNIVMDKDTIVIPNTFISLERQGIVTVYNRSDETVSYKWKEHKDDEDEACARRVKLDATGLAAPKSTFIAAHAAEQRLLKIKYNEISNKPQYSDEDAFTIEPLFGSIPARGKREFTITFNPQMAMSYVSCAFLDIQGKIDRLPLTIKGVGLGPHCALGFDNLDLGDIFVNSTHQYEVVLENRGSIGANWALQPQNTLFGPKFSFSPSHGSIPVGSTQLITIVLCSNIIGIVSETFRFNVHGSGNELELHLKGRVIGPTFRFDVDELDFGNVSYNFWHSKMFVIVNTSEIPMKFILRVPEDDPMNKEFEVTPRKGMILPHGSQKVKIDFLSNTVREYNFNLVVDIDGVGENLDSLPIKATCIAPDVSVSRETLDFGHCFIGSSYTQEVDMHNETALYAKYEVILASDDDPIRKKADVVIESGDEGDKRGTIGPRSYRRISITQTAKTIGSIHIPLYIRILGSESPPHLVVLSSKVIGPKVEVSPRVLDFGSLSVLTDASKSVMMTNTSPIPARFTARLTVKHSPSVIAPFSLKIVEGEIKPKSSCPLYVSAFLDEAMLFEDDLVISIQHNAETESVKLTVKGKGFAIVPSIPLDLVDLGDLFTTVPVTKTFKLINRGRWNKQIQWTNVRGKAKEGSPPIVFTITPERIMLNGKSEETFTIDGISNIADICIENFELKQSQTHRRIMKCAIQGKFQTPLLSYSNTNIPFLYEYCANQLKATNNFIFNKPLTIKNVSSLSLEFSLKLSKPVSVDTTAGLFPDIKPVIPITSKEEEKEKSKLDSTFVNSAVSQPFSLDVSDFSLKKGESAVVNIQFDASYRGDRVSHIVKVKLIVHFSNHAQRDTLNLSADINYPNIILDTKEIDFGCILNDTEQRKTLQITNTSKIAAAYTWAFEDEGTQMALLQDTPKSPDSTRRPRSATWVSSPVPINNVYDIVPFRGVVQPGGSETVEVIYNGIPSRNFSTTAICQVEGGPEYSLPLTGEASVIAYKFDKFALDFGSIDFDKCEEKEIILTNEGKVQFPFQVDLSVLSRPGTIEVSPMSGVVHDKIKVVVKFFPQVPDDVDDNFKIQIAHFKPHVFNVRGHGSYSSMIASSLGAGNYVTRDNSDIFSEYILAAKQRMASPEFIPYTTITNPKGNEVVPFDMVSIEAERHLFRDTIVNDMLMMRAINNGDISDPGDERTLPVKRKISDNVVKYILGSYILDFGSIIKGELKKKPLKFTNTSTHQIIFLIDRRTLVGTPVSLHPDKYSKILVCGSQNVEVTIDTRHNDVEIGFFSQEMLFEIKGGPLILVKAVASVILPTLKVSQEKLDFGTVLVGMTRMISVIIENPQNLPCEWQISYPDRKQKRDRVEKRRQFICKPSRGVLMPNQKSIIEVSFIPVSNGTVTKRILLKISSNPKSEEVICTGSGEELNVELEPKEVDLISVFPYQQTRQNFKIQNNSSIPIEVFSYDFDEKYLIEEEILRNASECFINDVLLLPPREVGDFLPDNLMECYYSKLQQRDKEYASLDFIPVNDEMTKPVIATDLEPPQILNTLETPPKIPIFDDHGFDPVDSAKPTLLLIVGPHLSGKTTHAKKLCEVYSFTNISIDDTVALIMEMDTPEGASFRTAWNRQLYPPYEPTLPPGQGTPAKDGRQSKAESHKSKTEVQKAASISGPSRSEISPAFLSRALAHRLRQADASRGVVIDDLQCFLTNNIEVLFLALKEAAAAAGFLFNVVDLSIDSDLTELRRALIYHKECEDIATAAAVKEIPPEEYDMLTSAEKEANCYAMKRQRDTRKALMNAEKEMEIIEKKRSEKIESSELITLQEEVEKEIQTKELEDAKTKTSKKSKDAETPPPVNWDEVSGPNRFKKFYEILRVLDESSHHVVRSDTDFDEVHAALVAAAGLSHMVPDQKKGDYSASSASQADEFRIEIPPPQTMLRIERPKETQKPKPVKFFKILTITTKELPAQQVKDIKKSKGAVIPNQIQEVIEERTRWVVQPGASVPLTVQFCSDDVNPHSAVLSFGVVGASKKLQMLCKTSSSYPDIIRDIRTIFPKRNKSALQDKYQSKVYIPKLKRYSFGPLLIPPLPMGPVAPGSKSQKPTRDKDKDKGLPAFRNPTVANTESLKFTNNGAFLCTISCMFDTPGDKVFTVVPEVLKLDIGQSGEVKVTAAPDAIGEFKNSLVICVMDNPDPMKIDLCCQGARPFVTVFDKKESIVDFGRMLIRKVGERTIDLKNTGLLPTKWKFTGLDKLPPEISLDVVEGVIEAEGETTITVKFISEHTNCFNIPLKIEVYDMDNEILFETLSICVKAEANDVIMEWTKNIEFKTVRVGETKKEIIRMLNKGQYEVAYQFRVNPKMAEYLTITPMEGVINGMHSSKDAVVCQVDAIFKSSSKEVTITSKKFGDIEMNILDPQSKKLVFPTQKITVHGEAINHRYSIKPQLLNFGPCLYRQKKTLTFEIANHGQFDIKFRLYPYKMGLSKAMEPVPVSAPEPTKGRSEKKAKKGHDEPVDMMLGPFSVSPSFGTIPPNTVTNIAISFVHEGNGVFYETMGIYIENWGSETPQGIPFEIEAESCVPGIIYDLSHPDSDSIFEEQQIVSRLGAVRKFSNVYSREDRCLYFGLVITGRKQTERLRLTNPTKVPTTVNVCIVPRGDTADAKAAAEVFEIVDAKGEAGKILIPPNEHRYCNIVFSPLRLNTYSAFFEATVDNGVDLKGKQLRLELRGDGSLPNILVDIPPPPVRHVDLSIPPESKYTKGKSSKSSQAQKGKVSQAQNATNDDDKVLPNTLVMQRTIVGETSSRCITVRNTGDLPTTVKFTMPMSTSNHCIAFPSKNEDFTLLPGALEQYTVFFQPDRIGNITAKLLLSVQDNHFDDVSIAIMGEGYFEPVTFRDVDENTENQLTLGDCYVDVPTSKTFNMVSHSATPLRFELTTQNPYISFMPSIGHLLPDAVKGIQVIFTGTTPCAEKAAKASAAFSSIMAQQENPNEDQEPAFGRVKDWDNCMKVAKWVHDPIVGPSAGVVSTEDVIAMNALKRPLKRVAELVPEPTVTVIESKGTKNLFIGYVCDYTQWEMAIGDEVPLPPIVKEVHGTKGSPVVDTHTNTIVGSTKEIEFYNTKLLLQRIVTATIRNVGKVVLPFTFEYVNDKERGFVDPSTFSIDPMKGDIPAGQSQQLTVKYTPLSVGKHYSNLIGHFPYGARTEVQIPVSGKSECPLVHFELPQADDYHLHRGDKPPVSSDTNIIQFFSRGVKVRNVFRFMVVNPSNLSYGFEWVNQSKNPFFKCTTMRGTIHSGKKFEMVFEYYPETLDSHEANWSFRISHNKTVIPFLLVGWAADPDTFFSESKVNFGQVIVGAKSKRVITIENREPIPYPFHFDPLPSDAAVSLHPSFGTVPSNSSLPIEISFSPFSEEPYNYTLRCFVKKALSQLTCNVKGEGYMTRDTLKILESNGSFTPMNKHGQNNVNIGTIQVNEQVTKKFVLTNEGRYNMDYKWNISSSHSVTISNVIGTVLAGGTSTTDVTYCSAKEERLIDYKMKCIVTNGNTYTISLNAAAANPNVRFSWEHFDFGPCFLNSVEHPSTVLRVSNMDDQMSVSVDSHFENNEYLELDVSSFVLSPGETREIKITFSPQDIMTYFETLNFSLNNLTKTSVSLRGEGTTPKVEVSSKVIKLGSVQVMDRKEVDVRVTCRSSIPTIFSLEDCLPSDLSRIGVSIYPNTPILLRPNEAHTVQISFRPLVRMRQFSHDIMMKIQNEEMPFITIEGSSQGAEVSLDCKTISFGSVVIGTKVSRNITILNSGDVTLEYNWNNKKLGAEFFVSPSSGIVQAHSEVRCDLVYQPIQCNRDEKRELELKFSNVPSLSLLIQDTRSVDRPPLTDILNFNCRVRETATQHFTIKNDTQDTWSIHPTVSNPWSVANTITVRPKESIECPVTYSPMICTKNKPNDTGSMFVPLPTGSALLFRLDGSADLPAVATPLIERDIMAKTTHTERLTIKNWLSVPQRFVVTQNWAHDSNNDDSVIIKGVSTIDVPANTTRVYRLLFLSYKEGKYSGTTTFTNEQTKEYQFFNLSFTVKAPKESSTVEIRTPARQRAFKTLVVSNPLGKAVTLISKVDSVELLVPSSITIPPKSDGKITVEFFPLLVKEYPIAKLVLSCPELGDYPFNVSLISTQPPPEKPIRLRCALGQQVSTSLRFVHYSKSNTEFSFKMGDGKQTTFFRSGGSGNIKVTACTNPKIGQEVVVEVIFEPPRIGEFRETVELSSPIAGQYIFSLLGMCSGPQRQGPIEIRPNLSAHIPFKNVYNESISFSFTTDNPAVFVLSKPSETLAAKKSATVSVQYKCDGVNNGAKGKLTVTGTPSTEAGNQPIVWVFYLRGLMESECPQPEKLNSARKGK